MGFVVAQFSYGELFLLAQYELLLFAAVFFAIGTLDEIAIDLSYFWLRLSGRVTTSRISERALPENSLAGRAAVFIPTWQEASVIGPTIRHALSSWRQDQLVLYVGCYQNDEFTLASALAAARDDDRVRIVIHGEDGPTSKADCLNRLYAALKKDEGRWGEQARMVVLHDAEDMVDPAALALLDQAIWDADFVQLPVLALPRAHSPWIAGHYSDEFAESHGKAMVVRDAMGGGVPGAGVGCAIARRMLGKLERDSSSGGPFAPESLTEDYELGLKVTAAGGIGRFLRVRTTEGRLVATRAYFPDDLATSVRQKTRWTHGIALQSWDRLGWSGSAAGIWMQLRDRRGPLAAALLAIAYALVGITALGWIGTKAGLIEPLPLTPLLKLLLGLNLFGFAWRAAMRGAFTTREYGWREGIRGVLRIPVSNIIAIMSGRRALGAYLGTLRGAPVIWDKTDHSDHPSFARRYAEAKA